MKSVVMKSVVKDLLSPLAYIKSSVIYYFSLKKMSEAFAISFFYSEKKQQNQKQFIYSATHHTPPQILGLKKL